MGTVEEPGSWWTLREARVSSSRGHLRGERARDGALSPPPLTEVKPTDTEEVPGRWAQGPQGQQCPITGQAWDMLRDTRLTGERGTMVGGGGAGLQGRAVQSGLRPEAGQCRSPQESLGGRGGDPVPQDGGRDLTPDFVPGHSHLPTPSQPHPSVLTRPWGSCLHTRFAVTGALLARETETENNQDL